MAIGQLTNQIGLVFALMLVGVLINKLGFMHGETSNDLTNILLYIVSPCLIISAFEADYSPAKLHRLLMVCGAIAIMFVVEIIIAKLVFGKMKDRNLSRITQYGSIYSNAGFMGVPLTSALFGAAGVFFAIAYLAIFNFFNWTHGVALFKSKENHPSVRQNLREMVLNPNIIAIAIGLLIFLFSIRIPGPVDGLIKYITSINTPLSMIVIGNSLGNIKFTRQLLDFRLWLAVIFRNLFFPIAAIFILQALQISGFSLYTTVLMAACPAAGIVVLFTLQAKGDASPAVTLMTTSTILSVATIPLVFAIMELM